MAKIQMKFNRRELEKILKNTAVRNELDRRGNRILDAINHEGYEVVSGTGKTRARTSVVARSQYARRSNAIHNTLVKHIGAGRG